MNSPSWILRASMSLCVICFMEEWSQAEGRSPTYLETNEVTSKVDARAVPALPICGGNSVCGYLQANAKGINNQPICACARGTCPTAWDPYDGYSVTQGSDQYKFCGKAPKTSTCEPLMTAYTSKSIYSKATERKLAQVDHILCTCPETHNYELAGQPNFGDVDAESEMVDVAYVCAPLPVCGSTDTCKFISETPSSSTTGGSFMVNRKCACASNLRCPTLSDMRIMETVSFGSGVVHSVTCQR